MPTRKMLFAAALAASLSAPCLAAGAPQAVAAAVADSARPAADTARDANRKPAQTLAFADIKPGAQVAELMPGGGYYTRLLSVLVGSGGHVYSLAPPPNPKGKDYSAPTRALGLPQPVDVVWTSDNYHDMVNAVGEAGMQDFDQRVFEALKPGGMFIVLDHAAAAGHGANDTKTMHRIDPETVKAQVTAAGFKLAASSNALRNPDDPHSAPVFDASVRGRTDQFIFKFVKP
jgi:predicted methyltransferase